jgi:hypothetical protein
MHPNALVLFNIFMRVIFIWQGETKMHLVAIKSIIYATVLAAAIITGQAAAQSVFINEIHYDNASTDVGESVEIAGPAGTDLSGWSIALYNGSATQLNVYDTISLSGSIADQCGGFGVLSFPGPANGIQNGSPDGLALVDAASVVVQFLSYEGSFTAASGPAAGMASTDIGVTEAGNEPVGLSLQLTGIGSVATDFTWTSPVAESPGSCNAGQTFIGAGDQPPRVTATDPADGAVNVPVTGNITITFSETVSATDPWFTFSCDGSPVSAGYIGGPQTFTLMPDSALPGGASAGAEHGACGAGLPPP